MMANEEIKKLYGSQFNNVKPLLTDEFLETLYIVGKVYRYLIGDYKAIEQFIQECFYVAGKEKTTDTDTIEDWDDYISNRQ